MTAGPGNIIKPYRNVRIVNFPESATQTFKKGEILIFDTTAGKEDKVKISGANPVAGGVGIAMADASGTEGTLIPVAVFTPDAEFMINYNTGRTVNRANLGAAFGVVKDATNVIWRLDDTNVTQKVFTVRQLVDAHGEAEGRVIVTVNQGIKPVFGAMAGL